MNADSFQYALENTHVVLAPEQRIETFGNTSFRFYIVSELMDSVNQVRVRDGRIHAERPQILAPGNFSKLLLDGFGERAREFADWMEEHSSQLAILKYGFQFRKSNVVERVVEQSMEETLKQVQQKVDAEEDPMSAIIQGVDDAWEVCLLKFTVDLIQRSSGGIWATFGNAGCFKRRVKAVVKFLIILVLAGAIFGTGGYYTYELLVKPHVAIQQEKREQATRPPPTPPPDISLPDYEKVAALVKKGPPSDARTALEAFLEQYPNSSKATEAGRMLGQINSDAFFTAGPGPDKVPYVIKSGDAIAKIERKLKTNAELIMRTNNLLDPSRLRIGTQLWVPQPDFVLKIDRQLQTVTLFNHGRFFKQYTPTIWNAPKPGKGAAAHQPLQSKVVEKVAWNHGTRVAFGTKEYAGSLHWVTIAATGFTVFAEVANPDPKLPKPVGGIGLKPADAEELSVLVNRNTPVLIE